MRAIHASHGDAKCAQPIVNPAQIAKNIVISHLDRLVHSCSIYLTPAGAPFNPSFGLSDPLMLLF